MSKCKTVSVAQCLSAGFSRERPGFDITAGRPATSFSFSLPSFSRSKEGKKRDPGNEVGRPDEVLKVSSAFVTTRAND